MPKRLARVKPVRHTSVLLTLLALLAGASGVFVVSDSRAQLPSEPAPPDTLNRSGSLPEASSSEDASSRIHSISVSGLATVDTSLVLATFPIKTGDTYRILNVREGVKALYRLNLFDQVEVSGDRTPEGIDLMITVVESPRIGAVSFEGNDKVDSDKLQEKITGTTGKVANAKTMNDVVTRLMEVYKEEGFPLAKIDAKYEPADKANERVLSLHINEGSKIQVTAIHFVGNENMSDDDLRDEMETKVKGFWHKGHLRPEKFEEDLEKLKTFYQRKGYRDIRITDHQINYNPDGKTAEITIALEEGPVYTMGTPVIEGNSIVGTEALKGLIKFKPGDRYNRQKIDESAGEIGGLYADRGYLYAQVDPEERIDSTTVHVTYKIVEQEPSKVREIQIAGNTRTKERVIRRQLYLYPGQKFDRSLLIRSQRELFQLGFFQDVQVDFRPLPNSYDVDLIMKVEEKAVGTASAGAGYSSQGGLTGFIELGHPNLFGNGQAVNLRLERGGRTENIELGFTEPWLFNTPTSAGIDVYHNTLRREVGSDEDFEVKRTGGALRLARRIPGIPYARGFASYRYERTSGVEQDDIEEDFGDFGDVFSDTTEADTWRKTSRRVVHTPDPIRIDTSGRNASSLTFGLTRNSTDHPLFPRNGMNTSASVELSGSWLQGDVDFQKYMLDNKSYLKLSILPSGMKPAWMIRSQFGAIGFYGKDDPLRLPLGPTDSLKTDADRFFTVESLELFRLGGTTVSPLRGYSDYEVVPQDNIRRRTVVTTLRDSVWADADRTIFLGVEDESDTTVVYDAYPGGRYFSVVTLEHQFTIVDPLHGLVFMDAGGTWNSFKDFRFDTIRKSLGFGVRMEIPLLGLVGFDYAYGFNRLNKDPDTGGRYNRGGWQGHLHFGRIF